MGTNFYFMCTDKSLVRENFADTQSDKKENEFMGYTTRFKGEISITPCPTDDIIELVNKIEREAI